MAPLFFGRSALPLILTVMNTSFFRATHFALASFAALELLSIKASFYWPDRTCTTTLYECIP